MARRERRVGGQANERVEAGPRPVDRELDPVGERVCEEADENRRQNERPAGEERNPERERDPDERRGAGAGERGEDVVEKPNPVIDDPAAEPLVSPGAG